MNYLQNSVVDGEKVGADEEEATDSGDSKPKSVLLNKSTTNWDNVDLRIEGDFKLKIASWNVSGLRAWLQKGGNEYMTQERPDIICLQETKCKTEDIPETAHLWGYHPYWLGFGGYAGVATYSRQMPINVTYGIGDEELDEEPRLMTLEYEKFFLINVYVPNSGRKLVTLPKRLRWNKLFHLYVLLLDKKKPVIICGDLNVAHAEIGNKINKTCGKQNLLPYRHFRPEKPEIEHEKCRLHEGGTRRDDPVSGQWLFGHIPLPLSGTRGRLYILDVHGKCESEKCGLAFGLHID